MALTPEDVVNKRFQSTKFREGYDQDEVDDFLDEVVVELRRLTQENEELRAALQGAGKGAAAAETKTEKVVAEPVAAAPVVAAPVVTPPAAPAAPIDVIDEMTGTTNLLQLARRLHEEHVHEGIEKRDALVAEGRDTAARLIAEAETQQRVQMNALAQERTVLETKIDELRMFEREYRQKLKNYIEGQLHDLDAGSGGAVGAAVAQSGGDSMNGPKSSFQGFGS
jgi:DivIVA domain-containing protein